MRLAMISFLVNLQVPSFIQPGFFIREEREVLYPCKASFIISELVGATGINSYMLRDHICNAKCTNLECMCFHCTAALGREDLPCEFWNIFLFHDTMNSIRVIWYPRIEFISQKMLIHPDFLLFCKAHLIRK